MHATETVKRNSIDCARRLQVAVDTNHSIWCLGTRRLNVLRSWKPAKNLDAKRFGPRLSASPILIFGRSGLGRRQMKTSKSGDLAPGYTKHTYAKRDHICCHCWLKCYRELPVEPAETYISRSER